MAPVLWVASGGFEMAVFPVTVQEYQRFVLGDGYEKRITTLLDGGRLALAKLIRPA